MDLSIVIPARNEMFLQNTLDDILKNIEGETEIIVVLDGFKPEPVLTADPRIILIYNPVAVGQRAATNQAVKISKAKYVMKVDAHCAFDKGFDVKMISEIHPDWTMVPLMRNLHAFDWVCDSGHRRYQGPSGPCKACGKETHRDVVWIAKESPRSVSYCFDATPHFQYFGDFSKRPEGTGDTTPSMSLQGSCFMLSREKYWELNVCDENFGSWGSQGIEVAVKTWLSGGSVMVNKKTWYAHMFRTQGGDFSFPYPISGSDQEKAKAYARSLFFNNNWDKQVRPLSWLVEKFWPVNGWTPDDLKKLKDNKFKFSDKTAKSKSEESEPVGTEPTKGIIYYTDNELDKDIERAVQKQLKSISKDRGISIVCSSLKKMDFGNINIDFPTLKRGRLTLFKQILGALEASTAEIIFFCEHDVLYNPSHFDFTPPSPNVYYYNTNVWKVRKNDGHSLWVDDCKQLSGLCANREFLVKHYKKRLEIIRKRRKEIKAKGLPMKYEGVSRYMGYEPGISSYPRGVDNFPVETWLSNYPNLDIRHDNNFTKSRWEKNEYVDKASTNGWEELQVDNIPGWHNVLELFKEPLPTRSMIFYTDNQLKLKIAHSVQKQLSKISKEKGIPILSSSLKKMSFGNRNIHFPSLKRGYVTLFKQIMAALEHSESEIIFFTEHDVLYHPSHFDFVPTDKNTFYYNQNVWYLRTSDGHAMHYDVNQLSGLCGYREALLTHFKERYEIVLKDGYSTKMGFEPMTHHRIKWKNEYKLGTWKSEFPNIDIRHLGNATGARWKKSEFRNQQLLKNWVESDTEIPGWGKTDELTKTLT